MNILLVTSKYMPEYSGAGFRAHNLYKRIISAKPEINLSVLCGSETENSCKTYDHEGFRVNRIACKPYPTSGTGHFPVLRNLCNFHSEYSETRKFISALKSKPDLIHVFGQNYVTVTAIDYATRNKIPLIIELVTDLASPFQYVPFPYKYFLKTRPVDNYIFVCISEKLRKLCLANGISDENIWCRPNPVDEIKFKPVSTGKKLELRRKLSKFADGDKLICYIAKYRPSKNQKFLIETMRHLPDEFKLFIKGPLIKDGPLAERDNAYFHETKELVVKHELSGRVQVEAGFCENVQEYYQMSDVYAFPSESEGLGTPVLESVACGIPVVANRIRGVTDVWIKDGANGYLCDLIPTNFAERIISASGLPETQREHEAANIAGIAGTANIDRKYSEIINNRTKGS